jgi:GrpB-like predicted nucleotidyltransferase (UPF0157 family)
MLKSLLEKAIAEKYVFNEYDASYPKLFASQKRFLSKALKSIPRKEIHHIGSTSIPGLGGKSVIDIILIVPKKFIPKARKLLEKAGFDFHHSMRERFFHQKYYLDSSNNPRLIHLHLTHFDSGELEIALAFRDYLRAHKKDREEYEKIKREASKRHYANGKKYAKHKLSFVKKTLKKALKPGKE